MKGTDVKILCISYFETYYKYSPHPCLFAAPSVESICKAMFIDNIHYKHKENPHIKFFKGMRIFFMGPGLIPGHVS